MKYKLINKDLEICWPKIYDDDIDWFRNQDDLISKNDREKIEEIWDSTKSLNDKSIIFSNLIDIYNILNKYEHITKTTKNSFENCMELYNTEKKLIKLSYKPNNYKINERNLDKFNSFLKDGVLMFNADKNLFNKLLENLHSDINYLKNKDKDKMEVFERGYVMERTKTVDRKGLQIIDLIIKDLDIYSYIKKYYNCEFKLSSGRLHRSTDEDDHSIQTLNDLIKDNPPIHKNLHIDPKLDMKCIIYLNEVTNIDGPFSYIKGSHLFGKTSNIEKNFAKAVNVYNINNTKEKRFEFLSLPKDLQKSANFGNYILNDSVNGKYIKNNLTPLTSDLGNIILFDPEGIHLGGNCYNGGERIAIQVILKPII